MSTLEQWTYEDIAIWIDVAERFGFWLTGGCCEQDRRDADLMFLREQAKSRARHPDESWSRNRRRWFPSAWGTDERFNAARSVDIT